MTAHQAVEAAAMADGVMEHLGPFALMHGYISPIDAFELGWKARAELTRTQPSAIVELTQTQMDSVNKAQWGKNGDQTIGEAWAQPVQPAPPHECKTDGEKRAFAFGWWKAFEEMRKAPTAQAEQPDMSDALKLAGNRLQRLAMELPHGSGLRAECHEWAHEAFAAIAQPVQPALDKCCEKTVARRCAGCPHTAEQGDAKDAKRLLRLALEALEPFQRDAEGIHPDWSDDRRRVSLTQERPITVGDYRKAHAAYAAILASKPADGGAAT